MSPHTLAVLSNMLSTYSCIMILAGHFCVASGLLCCLTSDIRQLDSHAILLNCLLEAAEISVAIEHIKSVREKSALMLQPICSELLASFSSSSKAEPILQFLQPVKEKCPIKNNDSPKDMFS